MNIGVVVDNDFDNDIRVTKEVDILSGQGHRVFILCLKTKYPRYNPTNIVTIRRLIIPSKIKNLLFLSYNFTPLYCSFWQLNISRFIRDYKLEIIHAHDLYMSLPASRGIALSKKKIPLILDLHENFPAAIMEYKWATNGILKHLIKPHEWVKKELMYLKCANKIIVISENFKETLIKRYSFKKESIVVYPNTINIKQFESYSTALNPIIFKNEYPTLFYFGIIGERRGVYLLIDLLKRLLQEGYTANLLLIGPIDKADKKKFGKYLGDSKLKKNFIHIPWIDLSLLPSYMNKVDISYSPLKINQQHESGVANKLFQYMYGGLPVIASNCIPQRDLVIGGEFGFVFEDEEQLFLNTLSLLNDIELRQRLGKNAKKTLYEKYKPIIIDEALIKLYRESSLICENNN